MTAPVVSRHCSSDTEPVHRWFGLSYANYLVLPRSVLQSMPLGWQQRFVACLEELGAAFDGLPAMPDYHIKPRRIARYTLSDKPIYVACEDPYDEYDSGRRQIPLRSVPEAER